MTRRGNETSPGGPRVPRPERSWPQKFRDAFRGAGVGVRGQNSFRVHFCFAAAVLAAAVLFRVTLVEWCLLILCMAAVLTAEMFNSVIESMARSITDRHDPRLADALDTASAAVLMASIGAALVGAIVFLHRLGVLLGWWLSRV